MPSKSVKYQSQLISGEATPHILTMLGKVFGRLTVVSYAGFTLLPSGNKSQYVWCLCQCGKKILGATGHLNSGRWRSCGCLRIDKPNRLIHGYAPLRGKREKIYHAWKGMHARVNPNNNDTTRKYHEKGLKVCEGWSGKDGFLNFKSDMMPITGKSLDRIENDLHYSCGHCGECITNGWKLNCRWADDLTQSNNRSDFNNYVTIDGKKMTYTEGSRYLGFPKKTLQSRIKHLGWTEERAISTPILNNKTSKDNISLRNPILSHLNLL